MESIDCLPIEDESSNQEQKGQLSKDMFEAGEKGNVEKCQELINQGADVNWKADHNLWYRTPLMQAAKEGKTEVCNLYVKHGAIVDAFTVSRYTALILAARNGRTETCQFLLSKGANVNNQTKDGETALMWAAGHGHTETCRYLIENGAALNLHDSYGITALTRAARGGHASTVALLLESGADVDCLANLGNKILDAESWAKANKHRDVVGIIQSYKIRRSLLKDGADPPTYVPLCACGSVNAGKTTLLTKLQLSTLQRRLTSAKDQPDTSEDMASRTCGIDIGIINVPGVGEFRKMDMAGHSWAFTSNEYFVGKKTSISMVLFDLSKSDDDVRFDLFHHLGLLKARETKQGFLRYRPEIVLIATHADKSVGDAQTRANAFFRMMMQDFQAYLNFYPKVMVLDCRDPCSDGFKALRKCLEELREKIIKNSERVPRLCSLLLPHIRSWAKEKPKFPVVSWEEFVSKVKKVNKTADDEGVKRVAYYLNESGEIVNDDTPELRYKVVLNVNWLTSHIFGIALAPANFPRSLRSDRVTGMVGKDELKSTFPECPLEQLIELFVRFEVCLPWDEQHLICDNYLFPSHLEQGHLDLDHVWPQFGHQEICAVGRIVECKNAMDTIPQSFFPKLQIRLLKRFGHRSPVWHGGIKMADDVVQILMTLSSDLREVNLCVWAPKGCEERCYAALKFIESVRDRLFTEISGGTELVHKYLSIEMLRHKKFAGYALEEVNRVLDESGANGRVVLQECGINELALNVKYCGIRRYLYPREHISHLPMRARKKLGRLLDSGYNSNVMSLSEQLEVTCAPVESDDSGPSGFTNVMPDSQTDRILSQWALSSDHRAKDLTEILERMRRFDAADVVGQWVSQISKDQEAFGAYRTRDGSGFSDWSCSSRRRGPSGASEHSELESRSRGASGASGGSPPLGLWNKSRAQSMPLNEGGDPRRRNAVGELRSNSSQRGSGSFRGPCSPPEGNLATRNRDGSGASENDFTPDRDSLRRSSSTLSSPLRSSFPDMQARLRGTSTVSDNGVMRSTTRSVSDPSFPTEESLSGYRGSLGKLSLEESQREPTKQMVPYPQIQIDLCKNCECCQVKLSLQETGAPKVPEGIQETSPDSQERKTSADEDVTALPVQVVHVDTKEECSDKEPLPTAETGEPGDKSSLPVTGFHDQLIPDLSSRLGLSWKPVALDLGFRNSELEAFEDAGLIRVQANRMLDAWLAENNCSFDCEHCSESLLERLEESFENAHRADLKDFLQHRKQK